MDQKYREEESYVQHEGKIYDLNLIIDNVIGQEDFYVPHLTWILEISPPQSKERVLNSDPDVPGVVLLRKDKDIVLDGIHRLQKAKDAHRMFITMKTIDEENLAKCEVKKDNG
jgi:hypothetical protein